MKLLEKVQGQWHIVRVITPLYIDGSQSPITECTLTLRLSSSDGAVGITEKRGKSVDEVQQGHWFWAKIIFGIIVVLSLFVSSYYSFFLNPRSNDEIWLHGFYQKYAPEVRNGF